MRDAVESGAAKRLVLNYAMGFTETDLEFLRDLPIRELVCIAPIDDIKPVYSLRNLRTLQIHRTVESLDLSRLSHPTELSAEWDQVKRSIGTCQALTRLYLGSYKERDFAPLAHLRLRNLNLKDRPGVRSLEGLDPSNLEQLGIFLASKLEDFSALNSFSKLRSLKLGSCRRLSTLDFVAHCQKLAFLNIAETGQIASLHPLSRLVELETLMAYGSTTVQDGDLSVLLDLPHLAELRMMNRKHNHPSVATVQQGLRV